MTATGMVLMLTLAAVQSPVADGDPDRLYGRVATTDGESFEGYLRWDRNESHWTDFLDGLKEIPNEWIREAESLDPDFAAEKRRERSLVAFGVRLTWDVDDEVGAVVSSSSIRFVHVRALEPVDARVARLTLTSGEVIQLRSSSTDIGRAMRGLEVDVPGGAEIEVEWRDLERVDFMPVPEAAPAPSARRIRGTVETWSDLTLTGYVSWDLDEILETDILDGREGGTDYEIPFSDIRRIEWESDRAARVFLRDGTELELRGTNDVDRDNRGNEVSDPVLGRMVVRWEDFKSVDFDAPVPDPTRPTFAPGDPIWGTVHAVDGRRIEGEIRWGNDEVQKWEILDGWYADVEFDVEFGAISTIQKVAEDRVVIVLHDGRRFELEDTTDLDDRHEGIFVKPDGRARRLVRWSDLDRVELAR